MYNQVASILSDLGLATIGSPTMAALIELYVTGLILLDVRQTQTRVTRFLPGRYHDALNRLLRRMPLSTRALMSLLVCWIKRWGWISYFCLDDVIVKKTSPGNYPGLTHFFAKKRKVYRLHIVVLLWCSWVDDVASRWPFAFGVPAAKSRYRSKLESAEGMIKEIIAPGVTGEYIVLDTHYTAEWFTKTLGRLGLI